MKWLDDIKKQLPMDQMQTFIANTKIKIGSTGVKQNDPSLADAEQVMKRIHYLLSEKSSLDLGKQEIFKRDVKHDDGTIQPYTYIVDFSNPDQIKRLKTVLLELADLSSPDSEKAKKESISGYLDYIAQTSV